MKRNKVSMTLCQNKKIYPNLCGYFSQAVLSVSALIILLMYTILNTGALVYNSSFFFAHFLLFVIYGYVSEAGIWSLFGSFKLRYR